MPACDAYPDDFSEFMDSYNGKPNGPAISMSQADIKTLQVLDVKLVPISIAPIKKHC